MPLDTPISERVTDLNSRYRHHAATAVLKRALSDPQVGRVAMVSSFGAESVVLLHMIATANADTPILFIDTQMLFPETLAYQIEVAEKLGLTDVQVIRADQAVIDERDPYGALRLSSTDDCCHLRKTEPLQQALLGYDAWITGRKRYQGQSRETLDFFESEEGLRIKINPLAHWTRDNLLEYIANNNLPRHPLVAKGYPSIGCAPCTSRVAEGEDERAGRWRGEEKIECGIHLVDGKIVRGAPSQGETEMNVIVTDDGFNADDWTAGYESPEDVAILAGGDNPALALDLPNTTNVAELGPVLQKTDLIRIDFPSFADGRGFSLARQLRTLGYQGRLRAKGHVLADQYAMARRSGFDEVEIDDTLAERQPQEQWLARANWQANDYQNRLREFS